MDSGQATSGIPYSRAFFVPLSTALEPHESAVHCGASVARAMLKPCITCGRLGPGSYCRRHRPSRLDPRRGSGPARAKFRRETLSKSGGRCAVCGSPEGVEAHHVQPLALGGTHSGEGVPLCRRCHSIAGRTARRPTAPERRKRRRITKDDPPPSVRPELRAVAGVSVAVPVSIFRVGVTRP